MRKLFIVFILLISTIAEAATVEYPSDVVTNSQKLDYLEIYLSELKDRYNGWGYKRSHDQCDDEKWNQITNGHRNDDLKIKKELNKIKKELRDNDAYDIFIDEQMSIEEPDNE